MKDLSINNSFYLTLENSGANDFIVQLFNQGIGGVNSSTPIINSYLWSVNSGFVSNLSFGIFTANTTITILDTFANVISSVSMTTGQTLAQYLALANPLTDINGNVGNVFVEQVANDLTGQLYNIRISKLPDVTKITFSPDPSFQATPILSTFVISNPFVTIKSVVPYPIIQQSQTGNVYKIMCVDFISNFPSQLIQPIRYGYRATNGDADIQFATPVVDPYQSISSSILAVDMDDFVLEYESIFQYKILAGCNIRLTFDWVRSRLSTIKDFNQALMNRIRMQYLQEKKILESERVRHIQIV